MPDALIVYYSYTRQTEKAAEQVALGLREAGWAPRCAAVQFADGPLEHPLRPLPARARALSNAAVARTPVPVTVDPAIGDTRWDLVLVGSPTWNMFPATPVSSFLRTPLARRVLAGTPFGAFLVCRGFWRLNRSVVRRYGEQWGGRWLGGVGLTFDGHLGRTMHAFLHDQVTGGRPERPWLGLRPTPYGLSPATLERARRFGRDTARRLAGAPAAPA